MQADEISIEDLPDTLAQVAEVIQLPATLRLVEHFGGSRVYVPMKASQGHPLIRLIGASRASALCARFGGQHINVAHLVHRQLRTRDEEIQRGRASGLSARELARRFGISERQVYRALHRQPELG